MEEMRVFGKWIGTATTLALAGVTQAALFDVTDVNVVNNGLSTAEGTSNGVGFSFSGSLWGDRTFSDESFQGFAGSNHVPAMPDSDALHTGTATTFTFDEVIDSALVYLSDNIDGDYSDFWDFGVTATAVSGDVEIDGTRFRITSAAGGVIELSNINSNVLSSPDLGDGQDFAIVVTPVPEPTTMALAGLGLALAARRRKAKASSTL